MKPLCASEAVARIEAGTLTSETLVRACLERIAEREPAVKAWAYLDPDLALAQAKAADAAKGGVLRGVPIGVKDIIDTHDMPTGHNSPIFKGKVPFGDAACVALCRTANAVILGKTVTTEFANRHPGPTTNPHNAAHTPGGSSSGSAAAVADGQVPLAFGTQTGGSVIRPAAYCGVIGYKPTFGDFSRVGIKMQCHSVDTLGLMARTLGRHRAVPRRRAQAAAGPHRSRHRAAAHRLLPHADLGRGLARYQGARWKRRRPSSPTRARRWSMSPSPRRSPTSSTITAPSPNYEGTRNYADERLRNPDKVSQELMDGAMKRGPGSLLRALCRRPAQVRRPSGPCRFAVRQGRRPALPQRAGRGARGRRVHRRSALQLDLDPGRHAVRYPAGRHRRQGPAARPAAGRAAPRGRPAALHAAWVAAHLDGVRMPKINGERLLADLRRIADFGRYQTGVHRPHLSPQDVESRRWLANRMKEAGLEPVIDGVGNVIGRSPKTGPRLLMGSHTDTQPRGGWLDGVMGVIYGLEVARALAEDPDTAHLAVDVASWADEEGHWGGMIGSKSFIGRITDADIDAARHRDDGIEDARCAEGGRPGERAARSSSRTAATAATSRPISSRAACSRPATRRSAWSRRSSASTSIASPSAASRTMPAPRPCRSARMPAWP